MAFTVSVISQEMEASMKRCGMLDHAASLPLERLKQVSIQHYDFNGHIKDGSVIVIDVIAEDCKNLFQYLFEKKFPIESVLPMCHFDADDNLSMNHNNSSAYNPRFIARTTDLSSHSYGMALDINPVQNPYIKLGSMASNDLKIFPAEGKNYLNRAVVQYGMVEEIVSDVQTHGFTIWGGAWTERRIDYHHFQVPICLAHLCSVLDVNDAYALYDIYKDHPDVFLNFPEDKQNQLKDFLAITASHEILRMIKNLILNQKNLEDIWDC